MDRTNITNGSGKPTYDAYAALEVSYFKTCQSAKPENTQTIGNVLKDFSQGKFKERVEYLRTLPNDVYKREKATLPAYTFAGIFPTRKTGSNERFTGLMCLDFDDVANPPQLRDDLRQHPFIYSAFISPSGKGVKALAVVPYVETDEKYKVIFRYIQKVFPNIDKGCSDLTRLCFACYDPNLWINPEAEMFNPSVEEHVQEEATLHVQQSIQLNTELQNSIGRLLDFDFTVASVKYYVDQLMSRSFSCDEYKDWLLIGFELASIGEEGRYFFHELSRTSTKYNHQLCDAKFTALIKGHNGKRNIGSFIQRCISDGIPEFHPYSEGKATIPSNGRESIRQNIIEQHPSPQENIFRLSRFTTMQQPKKLFGPLWAEGENAFLFAEDGVGKSILAVQIACSIATSKPISGFQTEVGAQSVALFDAELSDFQFYNRYPNGLPDNFYRFSFNEDQQRALVKADVQFVVDQVEKAASGVNAKILILDNLAALTSMIDATKTSDAIRLMGLFNELKKKCFSGLIIDHCRKPMKENEFKAISKYDLQGSKMKTNLVDSVFSIGKSCQGENYRYIKALKIRSYEMQLTKSAVATMCLVPNPLRLDFVRLDPEWTHVNDRNSQIGKMSSEGKTQAEIASTFGVSQQFVSKVLKDE